MGDVSKPVMIARTAQFTCFHGKEAEYEDTVERKVSVPLIPGEKKEEEQTRLEKAAQELVKTGELSRWRWLCHFDKFLLPNQKHKKK